MLVQSHAQRREMATQRSGGDRLRSDGTGEQYVLTMATGTLLYFHLLIVIAATKKKKHKQKQMSNADQTTGTEFKSKGNHNFREYTPGDL